MEALAGQMFNIKIHYTTLHNFLNISLNEQQSVAGRILYRFVLSLVVN